MHIYELVENIKKRPGFYIDDDRSIKRLRSFIVGYECGSYGKKNELEGAYDFAGFNDWVAEQLGHSNSTAGWCNMILGEVKSDRAAFDRFFDLLDMFRAEGSPKSKRLKALIKIGQKKLKRKTVSLCKQVK